MKHPRRNLLPLAASAAALAVAAPSLAADLVLKRAVLGTGGVGYFEYAAEVEAGETLQLRARLDQVDDILKSLIVIDPAGPASVTLPGKAGAAEAFASLPFSEADMASLPALIGALKGAWASVEAPRKLAGSILSATAATIKTKDGAEREITRVALLAGAGVEQFVLEDAEGLRFDDAKIGVQADTALKALRAARDRSGRDISIRLTAGGKRVVRLGYVAEAPVWKSAYRLSLPKAGGKARLQGWAVLENMTGTDWKDVALTLTSGSPVTFRQALYDPYYVARQTVAPPVSKLALPRADQGQMVAQGEEAADLPLRRAAPPMTMAAAPMAKRSRNEGGVAAGAFADELEAAPPPAPPTLGATATSAASAENLSGASFSLTAPVKVGAGESLTLPFIDTEVAADEAAWVQTGQPARNPWHAVRLANGGDVTLPAGSVTLYETTDAGPLFAGEAQLTVLPPAQNRLIAFGGDQKITVDRELKSKGVIAEVTLAKAVMTVRRMVRETTVYRLANMDSKPRKMIVDHPRAGGTTLASPPAGEAAITPNAWRLAREVAPGKTEMLEVSVDRPVEQSYAIGSISRAGLEEMLSPDGRGRDAGKPGFALLLSQAGLDAAAQERLQKIADAADALETAQRKSEGLKQEREAIFTDQERIRENLKAAAGGSDLAKLMTRKLLAQETRMDTIDAEAKTADAARDAAQAAMEDLAGKAGQTFRFSGANTF